MEGILTWSHAQPTCRRSRWWATPSRYIAGVVVVGHAQPKVGAGAVMAGLLHHVSCIFSKTQQVGREVVSPFRRDVVIASVVL